MRTTAKLAVTTCAIVAVVLGGTMSAAATPTTPANGPCLFGHVDSNPNSACRGSQSGYREVPGDATAYPLAICGPENDGEAVVTHDAHGKRFWMCRHTTKVMGDDYWEWDEVLGA